MPTTNDYALFSANAYAGKDSVVAKENEIATPSGWTKLAFSQMSGNAGIDNVTGFLARAYKNTTTNEIVIAYAGTTFEDGMKTLDWTEGNIPGATGVSLAKQIVDAARFYLDVRKDPANAGATISFTGHSLGGGLASLMAVYFDKQAHTFDQAPFERSADSASVVNALKQLLGASYSLADLAPEFVGYVPGQTNLAREGNVQLTYVKGEILRSFPAYLAAAGTLAGGPLGGLVVGAAALTTSEIAGPTPTMIDPMATGISATDLHDMRLLVALRQSQTFLNASQANPDFLQQIFKSPLYADNTQNRAAHNFLNLMIQQEALGNKPLDKLAEDIAKFKGTLDPVANGATGANGVLKSALYQLAIALYYGEGENRTGATNALFDNLIKTIPGGIQFTPNPNRPGDYKVALETVLAEIGSYSPFGEVSDYLLPTAERYTLPTQGALVAPEIADDKRDLMLGSGEGDDMSGGGGNDTLLGLGGADRLDGGAGQDTLFGGKGADTLIGGAGNDLYVFNTGDGADTIIDDGANRLMYDGRLVAGLVVKDASTGQFKFADNSGKTIEFHSPGVLTLADGNTITFQNQTSGEILDGSFGLQLYDQTPATPTTRTLTGDYQPLDFDLSKPDIQTQTDDLGNIILDSTKPAPGRADSFQDSAGNDLIQGLGGNDSLISFRGGDDRVEGGEGDDWMIGSDGNDVYLGGAGRDVLVEGAGNDSLYAEGMVTVTDALAAENDAASGLQGEALSGGLGDDLAIGGVGNDVLLGGTGDDILIAGAGDDTLEGDALAGSIQSDWSVTRSVSTSNGTTSYERFYNQFSMSWPGEGGADAIYAGAGADWVFAGHGNDYVDGGNDADVLFGEGGHDDLFGGSGNDVINGDTASLPLAAHGDDYLDGEDGDDGLFAGGGQDQLFGGSGADRLFGETGEDYLDGEDGDDVLVGGEGADQVFGGLGNDFLQGDAGNGVGDGADTLDGEAGDDVLLGLGGADTLIGGEGNDQIAGDNGGYDTSGAADTIDGGAGNDWIDAQGGDDGVDAGAGDDIVLGGLGDDRIAGGTGYDQLQGGAGGDLLDGGDDADTLFGEAGNDTLLGGAGNDLLIGGLGDDLLDGGEGDDVYYYSRGEGRDRIVDSGGNDWLVFNDLAWGQLTLGVGSLKLNLPDGGELHLDDFDADNPYAAGGIEYFQFADGAVLSKNQLIDALGIAPTGTPEADVLSGTALSENIDALAGDDVVTARAGNDMIDAGDGADAVYAGAGDDLVHGGSGDDVLLGEAGADTLLGEAGNDLLAGGAGVDQLMGGEGDDTYLFQRGDGEDTVGDALGSNAIVLGADLTLDAIAFTRAGGDLLVAIKNGTDRLTVKDWYAADSHFASVTLGDGTLLDHTGVEAAMPSNQAPLLTADSATAGEDNVIVVAGNALANDSDPEGRALRVTNPGSYAGAVGTLSLDGNGAYSYSLANGSSAVQSLAAGQSLTESFAYTVTDDDPNGAATAESSIDITVQGSNDLPVLGADSAATSEDAAPIGGKLLANDSDVDAGTTLTIADPGARVGAYGTLNLAADGAWSYSLANTSNVVQALAAGQTATENFTQSVSDGIAQVGGTLSIGIAGRNDAPISASPLADQSVAANTSWSWQLPAGSFTDIDAGDVLGYGATLADGSALPSWLSFSAATQTFSGRVPKSASGSIDIRVAATDLAGAGAADVFTLAFASGGGGGGGGGSGGGGSQGNEGVGNGVDAPPPGHDASFNDGAGTGPGNPGAQGGIGGGNGYRPPRQADIVMSELRIATPIVAEQGPAAAHGNSADAHAAAPGQIKQAAGEAAALAAPAGSGGDQAAVSPAPTLAAPAADSGAPDHGLAAWLDALTALPDDTRAANRSGPSDPFAVAKAWGRVDAALAAHLLAAPDEALGTAAHAGQSQPFLATTDDPLALLAANASLQQFKGLKEGFGKIA